jgi:hypothetical protein
MSVRPPPRDTHETGAVAVLLAILLLVFVTTGALAIDIGSGWATKRDLVVDLDAAALAGARTLSELVIANGIGTVCPSGVASNTTRNAVRTAVATARTENQSSATFDQITASSIDCNRRTVRVAGAQPAQSTFAQVITSQALTARGYAMAKAAGDGNLLPITFCQNLVALQPPTPGRRVTISYAGNTTTPCGISPGAWGWLASNSTSVLRPWIAGGYPYELVLGNLNPCPGAATRTSGWCNGGAGANATLLSESNQSSLADLICRDPRPLASCDSFAIALHDDVRSSGSNVDYRLSAFLDVVFRAIDANGNNSTLTLDLVAYTSAAGASSHRIPYSYLCSVDGAPSGDPTCN